MKRKLIQKASWFIALLLAFCLVFVGCDNAGNSTENGTEQNTPSGSSSSKPNDNGENSQGEQTGDSAGGSQVGEQREAEKQLGVPAYSGKAYFALNGNVPNFTDDEKTGTKAYEFYSDLDSLGRCGKTEACIGKELMPTEDRESISSVKPSGWINKKYDTKLVEGGYIYNRCHLIGFQLTGENANKENLITGTRYMNVDGMLPFENMVADYIKETGNHVMYRVTPIFDGNDLVACGAIMEAYSVEDNGDGICFNVYVYNVQPGIVIDYSTGNSWLSGENVEDTDSSESTESTDGLEGEEKTYVLNTNTKKVHLPTCSSANKISEANRQEYTGSLQDLFDDGYEGCGTCKPAA